MIGLVVVLIIMVVVQSTATSAAAMTSVRSSGAGSSPPGLQQQLEIATVGILEDEVQVVVLNDGVDELDDMRVMGQGLQHTRLVDDLLPSAGVQWHIEDLDLLDSYNLICFATESLVYLGVLTFGQHAQIIIAYQNQTLVVIRSCVISVDVGVDIHACVMSMTLIVPMILIAMITLLLGHDLSTITTAVTAIG